jgi:anti-sigma28 factor (negative regulator of flagellin synthesis)
MQTVDISTDGLEKIKNIINEITVKCESENCPDNDAKFNELIKKIDEIKTAESVINTGDIAIINEKIEEVKNFIQNTKLKIDVDSIAPVIEKEFEKITEKITNTIDATVRDFFERNTDIFMNNFEKVLTKTINKDCDNEAIITAIARLKNDFSLLIKEAKTIEPTENNNSELKEWFVKILEKLDTARVPSDKITVENKELLLELKKLKDEIVFEKNNSFNEKSFSEKKKEH